MFSLVHSLLGCWTKRSIPMLARGKLNYWQRFKKQKKKKFCVFKDLPTMRPSANYTKKLNTITKHCWSWYFLLSICYELLLSILPEKWCTYIFFYFKIVDFDTDALFVDCKELNKAFILLTVKMKDALLKDSFEAIRRSCFQHFNAPGNGAKVSKKITSKIMKCKRLGKLFDLFLKRPSNTGMALIQGYWKQWPQHLNKIKQKYSLHHIRKWCTLKNCQKFFQICILIRIGKKMKKKNPILH